MGDSMRASLRLSFAFLLVACSPAEILEIDLSKAPLDVTLGDFSADSGPDVTISEIGLLDGSVDTETDLEFDSSPDTSDSIGPLCSPGDGCFLDPCDQNTDCLSGWCVEHMGEGVCTQSCKEECPQGWNCQQVGDGPDLTWICVSDYANLCKPCATTEGCKSPGGAEDSCLDYGPEGNFCGGICTAGQDCPWGFSCLETLSVDGVSLLQCVADSGTCPCTGKSIKLGLTTPCETSNEYGNCTGKRVCTEEGLTACDSDIPSEETCNGTDDNCDGDTDEPLKVGGDFINLCNDENDCTTDVCNGPAGCEHIALTEGECIDGDSCTVGDHCEGGICIGNPVQCNDDNPCTDDSCDGLGGCQFEHNTLQCDDSDPCTVGDHCEDGDCVGFSMPCDCQEDGDCAALEDSDICNGTLLCDISSLPYECVVDPDTTITCADPPAGPDAPCLAGSCNPTTGDCSIVSANEGYPCDDGIPCTVGDSCQQGTCTSGVNISCNDGNPCTADSCEDNDGCTHTPVDGDCDDNNLCTSGDHCQDGTCSFDTLTVCNDNNNCTTDACHPTIGCTYTLNDAPCDDDDLCTTGDHCHLGNCISSSTLACNDGNLCTDDLCNPGTGCEHSPASGACDDDNQCTTGDHCSKGWCTFTAFVDCNDELVCNGEETCNPLQGCVAGSGPALDDANPCTFDFCDEAQGGVVHAPMDEICNDKLWCNGLETCAEDIGCIPGAAPVLDDNIPCTLDLCDEGFDTIKHLPDNSLCGDGDVCNGDAICNPLVGCEPGVPLDCVDAHACTIDSCDPVAGCQHLSDDNLCDDGTTCTVDSCEALTGCLFAPVQDGTPCSTNGLAGECSGGACLPDCQPGTQSFNFTGAPTSFTLPVCATTVIIETWGAKGGDEQSGKGGNGAYMKCRVSNLQNQQLVIVVGEQGEQGVNQIAGGGGGGGSFVWKEDGVTPLTIAGGGGGASYQGDNGDPGLTTESGGPGGYYSVPVTQGGHTDNGGGGGCGCGGGGWSGHGTDNNWCTGGDAQGGAGGICSAYEGHGGFGGGGAAFHGGGGGGGYSGGSGGTYPKGAGGGGSYCAGDLLESSSGSNNTHGKVVVSYE
jgi:hypothetical protein